MVEINGLLPIGSVVSLIEKDKKVMVIGVCQRKAHEPEKAFDYSGVIFPEGFIDPEKTILFNNAAIDRVFMIGYQDAEQLAFKKKADEALYKLRSEESN